MKPRLLIPLTLLTFALTLTCLIARGDDDTPLPAPPPHAPEADVKKLAADNAAFGVELYHTMRQAAPDQNLFISPYSVSAAMAMTAAGAKGDTAAEMRKVLHQSLPDNKLDPAWYTLSQRIVKAPERRDARKDPMRLSIVNRLFGQDLSKLNQPGRQFRADFLGRLAKFHRAPMEMCDFASDPEAERKRINDWVAANTNNRIKDLLPNGIITDLTRLVLTNAIWFKASWAVQFEKRHTRDAEFTTADGRKLQVPMMRQNQMMRYARGNGWTYVELRYANSHASMGFIVPDAGKFAEVETSLTGEKLAEIIAGASWEQVSLGLPRFRCESKANLKKALKEMGMPLVFDPERADFSGMDNSDLLYISAVMHQSFINVDETGTEAAAATAVVMADRGAPAQPIELTIDRPFIHVIRDGLTGSVLFMGRTLDLTASE